MQIRDAGFGIAASEEKMLTEEQIREFYTKRREQVGKNKHKHKQKQKKKPDQKEWVRYISVAVCFFKSLDCNFLISWKTELVEV